MSKNELPVVEDCRPSSGTRAAGVSLYMLSLLWASHTAVAFITLDVKSAPMSTAICGSTLAALLCSALIYLAYGVRRGKRIGGALALTTFLLFQAMVCIGLLIAFGYTGGFATLILPLMYVVNVIICFSLLLVTWVRNR